MSLFRQQNVCRNTNRLIKCWCVHETLTTAFGPVTAAEHPWETLSPQRRPALPRSAGILSAECQDHPVSLCAYRPSGLLLLSIKLHGSPPFVWGAVRGAHHNPHTDVIETNGSAAETERYGLRWGVSLGLVNFVAHVRGLVGTLPRGILGFPVNPEVDLWRGIAANCFHPRSGSLGFLPYQRDNWLLFVDLVWM